MTEFSSIPIAELLPQQPPFRFVDRLEDYSDEGAVVSFTPGAGNMLMEDGCLSAAGLMEHMAQASAARVGYYCKYVLHVPVSIGYIGQVRKFSLKRLPKEGELLRTQVHLRQEIFGITLSDMEVWAAGELIASASLKTALKND